MSVWGNTKYLMTQTRKAAQNWAQPYMDYSAQNVPGMMDSAYASAQLPGLRGAYQGVVKSLGNRMARMGLQGSGIQEEATRNANTDYMQQAGKAGLAKAGVIGNLASTAFGMGQAGQSAIQNAFWNTIQTRMGHQTALDQAGLAGQQATAQMGASIGQGVMSLLPLLFL